MVRHTLKLHLSGSDTYALRQFLTPQLSPSLQVSPDSMSSPSRKDDPSHIRHNVVSLSAVSKILHTSKATNPRGSKPHRSVCPRPQGPPSVGRHRVPPVGGLMGQNGDQAVMNEELFSLNTSPQVIDRMPNEFYSKDSS